ncbi:MAG: polyphenol oxidase family protein [Desulfohalobiaceae bacterium]|nr:polyphenol oxidase family protein [Desulfohalobiaceae bacterium]
MSNCRSIPFTFPGLPQVGCLFTTRQASSFSPSSGQSSSQKETAFSMGLGRLQKELGFKAWRTVHQVHGQAMVFCTAKNSCAQTEADALATAESGLALVVRTADCQPVLLTHASGRFIAALHVGWRANRANTPGIWIDTFCRTFGVEPADLLAVRGPSLSPRKSEFIRFDREWGIGFRLYYNPEQKNVNLWQLTRDQLLQAGLDQENIYGLDLCTHSLPELFFSHRRGRDQGRQAGLIWIR